MNIEEVALTGLEESWTLENNIFSLPLNTTNILYNNGAGIIKSNSLLPVTSFNNDREIMLKDNSIQIKDARFSSIEELKNHLQKNPIYVQYQLKNSITYEVDLIDNVINNTVSFNLDNSIPSLNTLIEANVERIDVSGVSPKTKYTLQFHSEFGGAFELRLGTLSLTINSVVGFNAREITTTDNVGDSKLLIYNQGVVISNVMLIEGQYKEELPYFEGLISVGKMFPDGSQKVVIESSIDATTYKGEDEIKYSSKANTQNDVFVQGQTLVNSCIESKTVTLNDRIVEEGEGTLADVEPGSKLDFCIQGNSLKNQILEPIYSISLGSDLNLNSDKIIELPEGMQGHITIVCEGNTRVEDGKLVHAYEDNFLLFLLSNSPCLWGHTHPWKGGK